MDRRHKLERRSPSQKDLTIIISCPREMVSVELHFDSDQLGRYSRKHKVGTSSRWRSAEADLTITVDSPRDLGGWTHLQEYCDYDTCFLPGSIPDLLALLAVARRELVDICEDDCLAALAPLLDTCSAAHCCLLLLDPDVDDFRERALARALAAVHDDDAFPRTAESAIMLDGCKAFVGNLDLMLQEKGYAMDVFLSLTAETVFEWCCNDDVNATTEAAVLGAVMHWAAHHSAAPATINALLGAVRLPLISPDLLLMYTERYPVFTGRAILEATTAGMRPHYCVVWAQMAEEAVSSMCIPPTIRNIMEMFSKKPAGRSQYAWRWGTPRTAFERDSQYDTRCYDLSLDKVSLDQTRTSTSCVYHSGIFWELCAETRWDNMQHYVSLYMYGSFAHPELSEAQRAVVMGSNRNGAIDTGLRMSYRVSIPSVDVVFESTPLILEHVMNGFLVELVGELPQDFQGVHAVNLALQLM